MKAMPYRLRTAFFILGKVVIMQYYIKHFINSTTNHTSRDNGKI